MFSRFLMRWGLGWGTALILMFFYASAFGQFNLLYQKDGAALDNRLGWTVAGAGDVDGDGVPDYILGVPYADPSDLVNAGTALVYSGASGVLLYQKDGTTAGDRFGTAVAGAGDLNDDGRADFIVGSLSRAFVYSGATGTLLFQKSGGPAVAGAGDLNGDGRADFIVGTAGADPNGLTDAGSAFLYSGATGTLLYQKNGLASGDNLGNAVAGVGDLNGDRRADFMVGAPGADPGGLVNAGSALVYSGATGAPLYQKNGALSFDVFGNAVAGAGDVNGDGRADFMVGARLADVSGLTDAGSAFVFSGASGALLYQKNGTVVGQGVGRSVAGAGDVDGDGKADFLVGTSDADPGGLTDAGSAFLYSGATGALLFQTNGTAAYDNLGFAVAGVGDLNSDGRAEFLIGAPFADPSGRFDAGSGYVYGNGNPISPCKLDNTPPAITCATDKRIACNASVVFDQPTATDNCDPTPLISILSTTQSSGPGPGEVTHTRTWTATDDSGNVSTPCSQKVVVSACEKSQITQATATCGSFNSGASGNLTQLCYTVKNGKIFKIDQSAFFYYLAVKAPSASFTVDVVQTCNTTAFPLFGVARNGVSLYDGVCAKIGAGTSSNPGQAQVSVTAATVGQLYIVSVKYSSSTLAGSLVGPILPSGHYDFAAKVNGVEVTRDPDGLNLASCAAPINGNSLSDIPAQIELQGNYPNPFNATTSIRFSLPQDAFVRLEVYNLLGQKVRTLVEETKAAGEHTVTWDGHDGAGNAVASGVYFYKMTAENNSQIGRMIYLK